MDTSRTVVRRRTTVAAPTDGQSLRTLVGARWAHMVAPIRVRLPHTAAADIVAHPTVVAHMADPRAVMVVVGRPLIPAGSVAQGPAATSVEAAPTAAEAMLLPAALAAVTSAEAEAVTLAAVVVDTAVEEAAVTSVAAVVDTPGVEATADTGNLKL